MSLSESLYICNKFYYYYCIVYFTTKVDKYTKSNIENKKYGIETITTKLQMLNVIIIISKYIFYMPCVVGRYSYRRWPNRYTVLLGRMALSDEWRPAVREQCTHFKHCVICVIWLRYSKVHSYSCPPPSSQQSHCLYTLQRAVPVGLYRRPMTSFVLILICLLIWMTSCMRAHQ